MTTVADLVSNSMEEFEEGLKTRRRINFFKLGPGKSVDVRFLQEIDEGSDNHVPEAGLATIAKFVNPPGGDGWKSRFVVPPEFEGDLSEWSWNGRLLINFLGPDEDGDEVVLFWDAPKSVAMQLLKESKDEGSITDGIFRINRFGKGQQTQYVVARRTTDDEPTTHAADNADDIVRPDDYLDVLTPAAYKRYTSVEEDSDGTDTDESAWSL